MVGRSNFVKNEWDDDMVRSDVFFANEWDDNIGGSYDFVESMRQYE